MIATSLYCFSCTRWVVPATLMLAPSPIIFVGIQLYNLCKPLLGNPLFERCDQLVWSTFQRMILFFFSNCNGSQVSHARHCRCSVHSISVNIYHLCIIFISADRIHWWLWPSKEILRQCNAAQQPSNYWLSIDDTCKQDIGMLLYVWHGNCLCFSWLDCYWYDRDPT